MEPVDCVMLCLYYDTGCTTCQWIVQCRACNYDAGFTIVSGLWDVPVFMMPTVLFVSGLCVVPVFMTPTVLFVSELCDVAHEFMTDV